MKSTMLDELSASQQSVIDAMRGNEDSSARPGEWSTLEVAGHLAASERECFEPRIKAIVSGSHPHFDFYSNEGRDFSRFPIESSLAEWQATRKRIIDYVASLTPEQLALTGKHDAYGEITIGRYLQIAIDHDREHLKDLSPERQPRARSAVPLRGGGRG